MAVKEWYRDWFGSPFYHKLYFKRDENEAEAFISRLLLHLNPLPNALMLDVACGRGRHAKFLAKHGYRVTGIDISLESISYAQKHVDQKDSLQFFQHDMRLPFWINYFDYAFNFFTSFGYFPTRREHDDAMRTIANSVKPGGIVLFDYLNAHFVEDHFVPEEEKLIDGTHYEIHRWHDDQYFHKKIIVEDAALEAAVEYEEKVAKFSLGDFTDMLSFQHMQVEEVFGDYHLSPYDVRKSPRMIVVARKTGPFH